MSISAPFTEEQVRRLNEFQICGFVHPFTCGNPGCDGLLVATRNGWICKECSYVQNWAHEYMVERDWIERNNVTSLPTS